ncbi:hypothetical protein HPULCUR_010340 [Helicostylum pulchrum]|uniref:Uncharacterized protein n=1 Tax=Helicostylum pulchrum TaxID=562976 RepID=A0ABP9YEY3_9FUNG
MQVYVEEFDPGGSSKDDTIDMDTNIDSVNKGINKDIKEEMRKEIEKQAEIIELTPPPFPLLGQQLTVRYHVLEKSSDRGGAETQLRPSWAQAERDGEIEVLMGKEKERVQNLEMAKFMAEKENEARMRDLFTLELRESAEDRSRSQDVKVRRKKKKQKKRKRNKARRREKRRQ